MKAGSRGWHRGADVPEEEHPTRRGTAPFVALIGTVLGATVLGVLALSSMVATRSYEFYALKNEHGDLQQQQETLDAEVRQLSSLQGLERAADDQGLAPAGAPGFLHLADGSVQGSPAPAVARPPVPRSADQAAPGATSPQGTSQADTGTNGTTDTKRAADAPGGDER